MVVLYNTHVIYVYVQVRKNISPQEKGLVDCLLSDKEKCPSVQEDAALKALHNTESIKR